MEGVYLRLYMQEKRRHEGRLLHEWIVELARALELPGCSVFHAVAGYGHHGRLHREAFFELQGELPMIVEFLVSAEQAEAVLARLRRERIELFWSRTPAVFGFSGEA